MPAGIRSRRREAAAEERRAAKRQQLLDAAVRVIRRDGPSVTMSAIAAEAGITKPIVYRHFGHRAGLHQAIAQRYASALAGVVGESLRADLPTEELLSTAVDAYLSFLERETNVFRFLWERAADPDVETTFADFRTQVAVELNRLLRDRLRPMGADTGGVDPWAHALVGMMAATGEWWLDHPEMPRAHLCDYLVTLLWQGFSGITRPESAPEPPPQTKRASPKRRSAS